MFTLQFIFILCFYMVFFSINDTYYTVGQLLLFTLITTIIFNLLSNFFYYD